MKKHWWEYFFVKIRTRIYIWYDFYSKISKHLKFVILQKVGKIDFFNERQKQT